MALDESAYPATIIYRIYPKYSGNLPTYRIYPDIGTVKLLTILVLEFEHININ